MKPGVITTHGIILIVSFVSCLSISCDKDNKMVEEKEQTLIGKWVRTEMYNADYGPYTDYYQPGATFEFTADSLFRWVNDNGSFEFRGTWRLDHDQSLLICEGRTYQIWLGDTIGNPGSVTYNLITLRNYQLWLYYLQGSSLNMYNNKIYKYTYCRE
jgi:hypothetical protein